MFFKKNLKKKLCKNDLTSTVQNTSKNHLIQLFEKTI